MSSFKTTLDETDQAAITAAKEAIYHLHLNLSSEPSEVEKKLEAFFEAWLVQVEKLEYSFKAPDEEKKPRLSLLPKK